MNHAVQGLRNPLSEEYPFYVLIETHGSNKEHDDAKLSALLEMLMENGNIKDGTVAQDETQIRSLWSLRELIPEACSKVGAVYKYDLSVPVPQLYEIVEALRTRLQESGLLGTDVLDVVGYGHVGDGNLHINVTARSYADNITKVIEPFVYELTGILLIFYHSSKFFSCAQGVDIS